MARKNNRISDSEIIVRKNRNEIRFNTNVSRKENAK